MFWEFLKMHFLLICFADFKNGHFFPFYDRSIWLLFKSFVFYLLLKMLQKQEFLRKYLAIMFQLFTGHFPRRFHQKRKSEVINAQTSWSWLKSFNSLVSTQKQIWYVQNFETGWHNWAVSPRVIRHKKKDIIHTYTQPKNNK